MADDSTGPGPLISSTGRRIRLFNEDGNLGDPNQDQRSNQPFILDLVTFQRLFFQTIPPELDYSPDASWVTINAPGRNTPLYQYTGSEDTLTFALTWYANSESREDVIKKCKWLESLTKNNGYKEKPHPVKLIFGDLFSKSTWIVYSAKYKLSLFDREFGMMPTLATQEIVLKRTSETNITSSDINRKDT